MPVTLSQFNNIKEFLQVNPEGGYEEWSKQYRPKKEKVIKEYSDEFNTWWCTYPATATFDFNGVKFRATRILREDKATTYRCYEEAKKKQFEYYDKMFAYKGADFIVELKNNGRPLSKPLTILVERRISDIYSNIAGYKPLQSILTNAIRFSVLIEKNKALDAEFRKLREASDRRKNMLNVLERKLTNEPNNDSIVKEIEKTKDEIKLLDEQLSAIATENSESPTIKTHLLELARKAYSMLLRGDKTSEKLYIAVCNAIGWI